MIALFGHAYLFADDGLEARVRAVYQRLAPSLIPESAMDGGEAMRQWFATELVDSGLFTGVSAERFSTVVRFPTQRYLALAQTYSAHRMIAPDLRNLVYAEVAEIIDRNGGYVDTDLATVLAMAYRPA